MKLSRVSKAVLVAVGIAAVLAVVGFVVMSLWNGLIPALFGGPVLHFWQAIGLLILTRILVGRVGRGSLHWGWRGRMRQDWQRMTPEERASLRETSLRRCGGRSAPESEPKA
ncbi:MAG: hypothetical protein ABI356_09825 [Steroidobacteraceae bacterium]